LNVDGDKLNFSDIGTGKPVIFIHGGCGSGKQWKALSTALSEKYRCIALDLFGNGEANRGRSSESGQLTTIKGLSTPSWNTLENPFIS
jgi:3-oxoadipate enol-lactonase